MFSDFIIALSESLCRKGAKMVCDARKFAFERHWVVKLVKK